jgi:hypothetical protein
MTQNDIARPELSVEERMLRDIVKGIRKLRWIGGRRPHETLDMELGALVLDVSEQLDGRWRAPHKGGRAHLALQPALPSAGTRP